MRQWVRWLRRICRSVDPTVAVVDRAATSSRAWPGRGGGVTRRSCRCPTAAYLRFRLETAYGVVAAPEPADLVAYLGVVRAGTIGDVGAGRVNGGRVPGPSVDSPPRRWTPRGPGALAQRQLRTAVCGVVAASGRPGPEGEGGDRPPQRRRVPLRAPQRAGSHGHPPGALRAGAVPRQRPAVTPGGVRPRRSSVPVLRHARPRTSTTWCLARARGPHTWENVVASCRTCNARKGDRLPTECGMRLRRAAGRPARDAVVDRVGRADRPRLAPLSLESRGRSRVIMRQRRAALHHNTTRVHRPGLGICA